MMLVYMRLLLFNGCSKTRLLEVLGDLESASDPFLCFIR